MKTSRLTAVIVAAWWMGMAHVDAQIPLSWDTDTGTAGAQGGTGNWLGTNFWFNGTSNGVWVDNSMATFGGTAGTVTVNGNVSVNGMLFNVGGYTIDGTSTLTLFSSAITVANAGDTATISAPLGGIVELVKNGAGTLTLSGAAANTITGFTFVNDGTLNLAKAGSNAINNDLAIGDNIDAPLSAIVTQGANNQIPDVARVIVNADGFWDLASGTRSETIGVLEMHAGNVATGTGVLSISSSLATNSNATSASISGLLNLAGGSRNFDIDDGTAAVDLEISAVISNGAVVKVDNGTMTLSGTNTFNGPLTINGGAVRVPALANSGVASPIGAGSSIVFGAGGTLVYPGSVSTSTNRAITLNAGGGAFDVLDFSPIVSLSGVISGTGGLTKRGAGQLNLNAVNTFSGAVTIAGNGFLNTTTIANSGVASSLGMGSAITIDDGILGIGGGGSQSSNRPITLTAAGGSIFVSSSMTATWSGAITGGLADTFSFNKAGLGVLILSGTNTFAGNIFVGNQILRVAGGSAIPDLAGVEISLGLSATFDLNGSNETIGSLGHNTGGSPGGGIVTLGSGTLTLGANDRNTTYDGTISGTGGLAKIGTGTQTFTANLAFTGPVAINAGAIAVADVADSGIASPLGAGSNVSLNGGSLIINIAANDSTNRTFTLGASGGRLVETGPSALATLSGVISGPGALTTDGSFTFSATNTFAGPLIVDGGIVSVPSLADIGVASPIGAGSSITLDGGALLMQGFATHSTNRPVTLIGGGTLGPGNGNLTFSAPITGTGGLGITGPGILVLSGNNTFSGNVSVSNTILRVANGNGVPDPAALFLGNSTAVAFELNGSSETIGSLAGGGAVGGNTTLGSGTLTVGANNTSTSYSGIISGTGSLVKTGTGTQTLVGVNTFTGSVTIREGAISVSDVTDSGAASPLGGGSSLILGAQVGPGITTGTLIFTGAIDDSTNRPVTLNGNGGITVSTAGVVLTMPGVIGGIGGGLIKAGPGTLLLSAANTYSGATTINLGTLRIAGGSAIPENSAVVLANAAGALLDVNGTQENFGSLAGGGSLGGNIILGTGGITVGQDGTDTTYGGAISGTGGTATSSLVKTGTGTLTLSGNNTYAGITSVLGGRLRLSGGKAIGDMSDVLVVLNAIAEWLDGTETIGSLRGDGTVELDSGSLAVGANGISTAFSGEIIGTGGLTKVGPGTLTLTGTPTYSGATNVDAGTLTLSGGLTTASAPLTVAAGAFLRAQNIVSRPVSGTGTITATGALTIGNINSTSGFAFGGTLNVGANFVVLADANTAELGTFTNIGAGQLQTFNGATLAAGRSLLVSTDVSASIGGAFTNNGTVNGPGNAGQLLTFNGDVTGAGSYTGRVRFADDFSPGNGPGAVSLQHFTFNPATTLTIEIGGLTAGSQYDRLNFTGTGTLDGTLIVLLIGGFDPVEGNTFTLLNGGTLTGTFDSIALPPLDPGLAWVFDQTASTGTLVVIPEPSVGGVLLAGGIGVLWRRRGRGAVES